MYILACFESVLGLVRPMGTLFFEKQKRRICPPTSCLSKPPFLTGISELPLMPWAMGFTL